MTEKFITEAHQAYIGIVKSLLAKAQEAHLGANPNNTLEACLQTVGQVLLELGHLEVNEAFVVLGFIATKPLAFMCKGMGPDEVSKVVKSMAELFAYTILDRLPSAIDQITQQEKAQRAKNNKVVLPS
jgi:hypothetical protein